jgi:hypothetical protein
MKFRSGALLLFAVCLAAALLIPGSAAAPQPITENLAPIAAETVPLVAKTGIEDSTAPVTDEVPPEDSTAPVTDEAPPEDSTAPVTAAAGQGSAREEEALFGFAVSGWALVATALAVLALLFSVTALAVAVAAKRGGNRRRGKTYF